MPLWVSGGLFVQSETFIAAHGGQRDDASIDGQESNPSTWRLAAMNLVIRGFAADLGQESADTFTRDQIPDQKFDDIFVNPPFNSSDWGGENYESDPRWVHGRHPSATRTVRGCSTGSGTCAQAGKRAWCWRQPCRSRPIRRHPESSAADSPHRNQGRI